MADVVSMSVRFSADGVTQTSSFWNLRPCGRPFTLQMQLYTLGPGAYWSTGQTAVTYHQEAGQAELMMVLPMQDDRPLNWPWRPAEADTGGRRRPAVGMDRQPVTLCGPKEPGEGPDYTLLLDLPDKEYSVNLKEAFGISLDSVNQCGRKACTSWNTPMLWVRCTR